MIHRAGRILLTVALALAAGAGARAQTPMAKPDLNKLADEAQVWLGDLVRINSVNPPGNEAVVAKYISAIFQKEGISNEVIEMAPGRSIVIARLQAGPLPDPTNALLLVAHQDTVGVDTKKWTVDPFAATIRDGYMYGRGSIDDKAMLAANIATMVQLKRSGARLARDVIFLATDDEEQGGSASIKVTIQKYWDKIACAYALNEGGRVMVKDGKVQYVGIQASEKVAYNVTVTATGSSGHGSLPKPDNAVVHLAAAVQKLGTYQVPGATQHHHAALFRAARKDRGRRNRQMDARARAAGARRPRRQASLRRKPDVEFDAARHDCAHDVAGRRPRERGSLGSDRQSEYSNASRPFHRGVDGTVHKIVNDPQIKFQLAPDSGENAPPSDLTTPCIRPSSASRRRNFPARSRCLSLAPGPPIPRACACIRCRRTAWSHFPMIESDSSRVHADDERIPVDSFHKGVVFLYHVVSDFASTK